MTFHSNPMDIYLTSDFFRCFSMVCFSPPGVEDVAPFGRFISHMLSLDARPLCINKMFSWSETGKTPRNLRSTWTRQSIQASQYWLEYFSCRAFISCIRDPDLSSPWFRKMLPHVCLFWTLDISIRKKHVYIVYLHIFIFYISQSFNTNP